jgi:hypothetical protein
MLNMNESMMRAMRNFGMEVIKMCADKYNFNAEEAMRELGDVRVVKKERKEKKSEKASLALPFSGECDMSKCQALRQNSGLYTQCQSDQKNGVFCNNCHKLAKKSEDGVPEYGTIHQRMECYTTNVEYVDPKGRKPVAYTKVMKKYKLTQEQVLEEAKNVGIEINPIHFEVPSDTKRGRPATKPKEPKEPKGPKGRPKKEKTVIIADDDDDDLFASLVASANSDNDEIALETLSVTSTDETLEKAAKKQAKAAEKEAKAAEKEAKAAEKAQKEAEKEAKAAEKAQKEAEKEAKAAEKAQKEAEKEAKATEKAQKEAEKEAKAAEKAQKAAEKEAKAAEKAQKEAEKEAEKEAKAAEKAQKAAEKETKKGEKETKKVEKEDEPEVVKKMTYEGKTYLKSKNSGVIYDYDKYVNEEQQIVIGKWNETTQKIDMNTEEIEDEYDSESDDE